MPTPPAAPLTPGERLHQRLTTRYIVALTLVAILTTCGHTLVHTILQGQAEDGRIINLASRQRVLSQKLANASLNLVDATTPEARQRYALDLREALLLLTQTHEALQYGSANFGLSGHNSPTVRTMYASIAPSYRVMVGAAEILMTGAGAGMPASRMREAVEIIQTHEERFLAGMNGIVFQYEQEASTRVRRLQLVEWALLLSTLLVLLLEAFLVFKPAAAHARTALDNFDTANREMQETHEAITQAVEERNQAEEARRRRDALLTAVLNSTDDYIWAVDPHYRLLTATSAAQAMLAHTHRRPVAPGAPLIDPAGGRNAEAWATLYDRALSGEVFTVELETATPHGTRSVAYALRPILHSETGLTLGASVFGYDVSELRRVIRMKDEFVATVSHELRTPLTTIRGSLGLLRGGAAGSLPEAAHGLVEVAHKGTERLVQLITDLLDVQYAETGSLRLELIPQPLRPILEGAVASAQAATADARYRLVMPTTDVIARVDQYRLEQVLGHLLSNAAKFSPPGSEVEVLLEQRSDRACICVRDQGPGIPASFQPHLFAKFTQADATDRRDRQGPGLGLHISKVLTEHMDGRLSFSTHEQQGTTFVLDLPLAMRALRAS